MLPSVIIGWLLILLGVLILGLAALVAVLDQKKHKRTTSRVPSILATLGLIALAVGLLITLIRAVT